jgi:hypothetical protein
MFLLCPKGGRKGTSYFFSDLGPPRRVFGNPNIVGTFACPSLLSNGLWRFKHSRFACRAFQSISQCVSQLARDAELNVNAFYRTRSTQGNPELKERGSTGMQFTIPAAQKRGLNHGSTGCAS